MWFTTSEFLADILLPLHCLERHGMWCTMVCEMVRLDIREKEEFWGALTLVKLEKYIWGHVKEVCMKYFTQLWNTAFLWCCFLIQFELICDKISRLMMLTSKLSLPSTVLDLMIQHDTKVWAKCSRVHLTQYFSIHWPQADFIAYFYFPMLCSEGSTSFISP